MGLDATELIALTALVLGSFAATNLDNLLILVFLLGGSDARKAWVLLGFLVAVICLVSIAALGVALGAWLDPGLVGYLGLAPLSIGIYALYHQHFAAAPDAAGWQLQSRSGAGLGLSSFTLMLGNSGDSLAVLMPLLAESNRESLLLIIACYLLAAVLWSLLSLLIAGREALARRIERSGSNLVPWVLIVVGVYILMDTGTDTLL